MYIRKNWYIYIYILRFIWISINLQFYRENNFTEQHFTFVKWRDRIINVYRPWMTVFIIQSYIQQVILGTGHNVQIWLVYEEMFSKLGLNLIGRRRICGVVKLNNLWYPQTKSIILSNFYVMHFYSNSCYPEQQEVWKLVVVLVVIKLWL